MSALTASQSHERKGCGQLSINGGETSERSQEEIEVLTDEILDNLPPGKIYELLEPRLLDQDISGFFYLTTSLKLQANILEPTKTEKERREEEERRSEVETS